MRGLPSIWFALILLALLAALTYWIDRTVQPPAPPHDGSARHDVDYIVSNFTSMRTDANGNPRHSLKGEEMRHYPDDDSTDITQPVFTQFSLKKPTLQAQGDRGKISSNGENVYFMDNVKVVRAATRNKGELTILTDYLHIVPEQDFVETDRPVTILQAPRTVIHANGLQYYKKQGSLSLFNRIKVHYERPDAPPMAPLTIDQVAGKKTRPVVLSKVRMAKPAATQKLPAAQKQMAKTAKTPISKAKATKKTKATGNKTRKTEKSKTRIRRQYGNPTN